MDDHSSKISTQADPSDQLIAVVQELSLARDLETVQAIVRRAARELTGADGATFVLRDGDLCYYADENAIAPLWKGRRFPMTTCVSGWAMLNRTPAVIENIYSDPRVPAAAYRSTFVKSMVMVPIRTREPVGAIGNYWANRHLATEEEVKLLQALADSASIAMENVQLYQELEDRVKERTAQLAQANRELEAFSYSVSHDLRAPLRAIDCFSQFLEDEKGAALDETGRGYLQHIRRSTQRMGQLIEDLLKLARISKAEVHHEPIDLSAMAHEVGGALRALSPERQVQFEVDADMTAVGDARLVRVVLENLLSNAWKFTSKKPDAEVRVGVKQGETGPPTYFVQDNGAGFNMAYVGKLFGALERLHAESDFPGTGIGLATVQRIVHKHGGRIWAEAAVGRGATFSFTLEASPAGD
jgi:signal transduction histidine kinase